MDILSYEFTSSPDDSYNGMLGGLVRELRLYRNETDSTALLDEIQRFRYMESLLQEIDENFGNEKREYINEILAALDREQDIIFDFEEEITIACTAVLRSLYNIPNFSIAMCSYELIRAEHLLVCRFETINKEVSVAVRDVIIEIFKSVCFQKNIIFLLNKA